MLNQEGQAVKSHKKIYILIVVAFAVAIIAVAAFAAPSLQPHQIDPPYVIPRSDSSMALALNYTVGDHMVYEITNVASNHMSNASLDLPGTTSTQTYNSTVTTDVIGSNSQNFTIKETIVPQSELFKGHNFPALTINISKASYYNNFIAPGAPLIFYNTTSNPTISAYLAQPRVDVGEVWTIPVNTGNASLGVSGEVTIRFAGIQNITTPAGTYRTMRIESTSNILNIHSDGTGPISLPQGVTLQFNGTAYLEQATCRLIKADLTQKTTTNSPGITQEGTMYTEKTLIQQGTI